MPFDTFVNLHGVLVLARAINQTNTECYIDIALHTYLWSTWEQGDKAFQAGRLYKSPVQLSCFCLLAYVFIFPAGESVLELAYSPWFRKKT